MPKFSKGNFVLSFQGRGVNLDSPRENQWLSVIYEKQNVEIPYFQNGLHLNRRKYTRKTFISQKSWVNSSILWWCTSAYQVCIAQLPSQTTLLINTYQIHVLISRICFTKNSKELLHLLYHGRWTRFLWFAVWNVASDQPFILLLFTNMLMNVFSSNWLLILRLPFPWRSPFGYFIAVGLQIVTTSYVLLFVTSVMSFTLGSFLFAFSFTKDVSNKLRSLNQMAKNGQCEAEISKEFAAFILLHSRIKQLSMILKWTIKPLRF